MARNYIPLLLILLIVAALYRDDFMSGFGLRDSFNFDDWQFFQTEALRHDLASALKRLVRCHIAVLMNWV